MDMTELARAGAALLFTVGLMLGGYFGLQRLGPLLKKWQPAETARRLAVVQTLPVDARRKFVVVRFNDREHLILTGPSGDIVVTDAAAASPARLAPVTSIAREENIA